MKQFERIPQPQDTLWLTPDGSGVRFALTPADANGNELVAVLFNDPAAGPVAFAVHPSGVEAITAGLQRILDNIAYLRTENNKIRNEREGSGSDD